MNRSRNRLALTALALVLAGCSGASASKETLLVYCAAGLRGPVETAARRYEAEYHVQVQLQYGGSQTLLANAELSKRGDLYIPADDDYLTQARSKHLIDESLPLAVMRPVLAVRKESALVVDSLGKLPADVKLALADPDAAAVGRLTREALGPEAYKQLAARALVVKPTVIDVANAIQLGAVDAGIVWDATVAQLPKLRAIDISELKGRTAPVSVAILRLSQTPTAALRFARYMAASDQGLKEFAEAGYTAAKGDAWAEKPELKLMCGAMLRPAVEQTLKDFEDREGATLTRIYNGCGILTAQMKASGPPDAYFACDSCFVLQVADMFHEPTPIARNDMVLAVPRGNPKGIKTLNDLTREGLKVGVGNAEQSALGVLTARLLKEAKLDEAIQPNVKVESATGDHLINQLRADALDVAIVYRSNVAASSALEAVDIPGPQAQAEQPFVISRTCRYPELAGRLLERLRSAESKVRFQAAGFHWVERK
jgi:molybdenum ABC transporter molybdate-binding protein